MCRAEVIATQGMTKIERCSRCGCVHLHVGPLSLRLESHTARDLFRTIAGALEAFEPAEAPAPQTETPLKLN